MDKAGKKDQWGWQHRIEEINDGPNEEGTPVNEKAAQNTAKKSK
jgi:hypothetical protein